jgi:hypothetical protein
VTTLSIDRNVAPALRRRSSSETSDWPMSPRALLLQNDKCAVQVSWRHHDASLGDPRFLDTGCLPSRASMKSVPTLAYSCQTFHVVDRELALARRIYIGTKALLTIGCSIARLTLSAQLVQQAQLVRTVTAVRWWTR